jgi:DNA polymerase-3 subunit gamma/tau
MNYLALYRKYRPVVFEDVIGQDHIIKTLINQIDSGKISHAYLFNGTRGTGKTSTAKIFAKAINCISPVHGSPCLKCEVCKSLEDASNLDILEIDAASNNRVDEIRDLKQKIKYPPVHGKYKVYIIDEVHMLTDSAFNALLKTLEEPPSHAVFVLATTEVHKLPATILSRVMRFDFKLVSNKDLKGLVSKIFKSENIKADEESLNAMVVAGEGSVRDTLSVADLCASYSSGDITYKKVLEALGTTTKSVLLDLAESIIQKDAKVLLTTINDVANEGKNLSVLAKDLTSHFRDLLVVKSVADANNMLGLPHDLFDALKKQANEESAGNLLYYMQKLSAIEGELKYSNNERLLFETATLACMSENAETIENIGRRLDALEKGQVRAPVKKQTRQIEKPVLSAEKKPLQIKIAKIQVEKPKKAIEAVNKYGQININKLWGKVLLDIDNKEYPILYTVVADAKPISLSSSVFILSTTSLAVYNTLKKANNISIIKNKLLKQEVDVNVEVLLEEKQTKDEKELKLKKKFGDILIIK